MSEWMDIETAPIDGTVFLGYRDGRVGMASRVPRTDCEFYYRISKNYAVS